MAIVLLMFLILSFNKDFSALYIICCPFGVLMFAFELYAGWYKPFAEAS